MIVWRFSPSFFPHPSSSSFLVLILSCGLRLVYGLKAPVSAQLDFSRNGHCKIPKLLDPGLLQQVNEECRRFMRKNELVSYRQKVAVAEGVTGSAIFDEGSSFCRRFNTVAKCRAVLNDIPFLQYFNLFLEPDVGDVVKRLSRSSELAELAASLMGVKEVRLYQVRLDEERSEATGWLERSDSKSNMPPIRTTNDIPLVASLLA